MTFKVTSRDHRGKGFIRKTKRMKDKPVVVALERIESQILLIRGQKVMLSKHLAELYEVAVRVLVQAVKRNIERFPEDFMFQLNAEEFSSLKSQIVISSWGGSRAAPDAFTEQGVAMLSSVLRSRRAIRVNVDIMRPSSVSAKCSRRTRTSPANSARWRRNTTRSSRWCSTQSVN